MSLWEYKVITSGRGGFATPAHLDKFLNDLGRDEWEIIEFRTSPDNALAFNGLARRSTQRDWTLQDAAAAAAKAEAEKLRAEFAAKFQAATAPAPVAEEKSPSFLEEKAAPDDGFRKPVDTSRDSDPDGPEEDAAEKGEWENLDSEDELPSFFDALKPHMRRNQRGPGMSVGTDYLAKKWGLAEEDIKGALVECGLQIPADENAKPVYAEYDGDLFWVNINRRGEVWINTREKPRPVFRVVQAQRLAPEATEELAPEQAAPRSEDGGQRAEAARRPRNEPAAAQPEQASLNQPETPNPKPGTSAGGGATAALPPGSALLARIRPLMRRNRRGPGGSGSATFLARALKCSEADLVTGFAALGLVLPPAPTDKPIEVEIEGDIWWLNQDSRGGLWINGREKRDGEIQKSEVPATAAPAASMAPAAENTTAAQSEATTPATPTEAAPASAVSAPAEPASDQPAPAAEALVATTAAAASVEPIAPASAPATTGSDRANVLAAVRLLLQETKTGSVAGKLDRVAGDLGKSPEELTAALTAAGLKLPEKPRERPVFVEHAGEIFWFNVNPKGELWVNAKVSKFADKADDPEGDAGKRLPRRGGRGRGPRNDSGSPETEAPTGEPAPNSDTPPAADSAV